MEKQTLVLALMGVLLVVTVLQSFQLVNLSEKAKTIGTASGGAPASGILSSQISQPTVAAVAPASGAGNIPSNLQSLPQQVGGC